MNETFDIDGDGIPDGQIVSADLDNDGIDESMILTVDTNSDGSPDALYIASDTNLDGVFETESEVIDTDFDGNPDFGSIGMDTDGDGIIDERVVVADSDGDGVPDVFSSTDGAEAIWGDVAGSSPLSEDLSGFAGHGVLSDDFSSDPVLDAYNKIHGTPMADLALWEEQDDLNSCAVAATNMMFRTVGLDIDEQVTAAIFESRGIYDPDAGTNPELIDDVINEMAIRGDLDLHAVQIDGFTPESLQDMLDDGIRPLVGVDSSELYDDGNRLLNAMGLIPDTGHAVQVIGVIHNEEGDFVVINDPGTPDGAGQVIPMKTFLNASEDFGNTAIAVLQGSPSEAFESNNHWGKIAIAGLSFGALGMMRLKSTQSNSKFAGKR